MLLRLLFGQSEMSGRILAQRLEQLSIYVLCMKYSSSYIRAHTFSNFLVVVQFCISPVVTEKVVIRNTEH